MENINTKNISQKNEENLSLLKQKARQDYLTKGMTLIKCPNCNERPVLYENDDMGFIMNCKCGSMSIYEKF